MNQGVFVERGTDKSQHAQFSVHLRLISFQYNSCGYLGNRVQ